MANVRVHYKSSSKWIAEMIPVIILRRVLTSLKPKAKYSTHRFAIVFPLMAVEIVMELYNIVYAIWIIKGPCDYIEDAT